MTNTGPDEPDNVEVVRFSKRNIKLIAERTGMSYAEVAQMRRLSTAKYVRIPKEALKP